MLLKLTFSWPFEIFCCYFFFFFFWFLLKFGVCNLLYIKLLLILRKLWSMDKRKQKKKVSISQLKLNFKLCLFCCYLMFRYSCSICGRRFAYSYNVRPHEQTHTDRNVYRKFKCTVTDCKSACMYLFVLFKWTFDYLFYMKLFISLSFSWQQG